MSQVELSGEREALREKVVLILYDVADHISVHTSSSTMKLVADRILALTRPAAADGLRDIAGEVWDLLLPYLPLGNRTALYDEMREEFPIAALGSRKEDGLRAWAEKVVSAAAQCGCEHCQSWYRSLRAALGRKEGSA